MNLIYLIYSINLLKCASDNYTAQDTPIRDQIIIGTKDNDIRQETLKRSWDLETLGREGMKMESAARGGAKINGEDIYKMGTYSFKSLKNKRIQREDHQEDKNHNKTSTTCYNCSKKTNFPIKKHKLNRPARTSRCYNCNRMRHFSKFWKSTKYVRKTYEKEEETKDDAKDTFDRIYNVNLFRITTQHVFKESKAVISKLKLLLIILLERI